MPEPKLKTLLAQWKKTPAQALAEAIVLSDRQPPFEGTTDEWVAAAAKATVTQRSSLLGSIIGKTLSDTRRRLEAIVSWADDPRTIAAIESLIRSVPWSSDSSKPTWNAVFAMISGSGSARYVEIADEVSKTWQVRESFQKWLGNALKKSIKTLPRSSPTLSADELKALRALPSGKPAKAGVSKDEAGLLADVYAHPDDDAPRLVYADLLQERSDPRGEFIVLQISGGDSKREKALLKAHGKSWLGALAPVLGADFEFRRGFLSTAVVKFRHRADAERYASLPEWGTVENLTWSHPNPIPEGQEPFCRMVGPSMRGLKKAFGAWAPHLLAAKTPWKIEELEVGLSAPTEVKEIIESKLFPKVHRLMIDDSFDVEAFAGMKSLGRIKWLDFYPQRLGEALARLSELSLERFDAHQWLTATRGRDGQLSKIVINVNSYTQHRVSDFVRQLPEGLAESIDFDVSRGLLVDPKIQAAAKERLRGTGASYFDAQPALVDASALPSFDVVVGMGFRADGSLIVVDREQIAHIDANAEKTLQRFPINEVYSARVIENGKRVVAMGYHRVALFDVASGKPVFEAKPKVEHSDFLNMTLSPDGRFVNVSSDQVFDLHNRVAVKPPRGSVGARAIRADQKMWVTRKLWEAPFEVMREGSTRKVPLHDSADTRSYRFVGEHLIGVNDSLLRKWELASGTVVAQMKVADALMYFSDSGALVLVPTAKNAAAIVDVETFKVVKTVPERTYVMAVSENGDRVGLVDPNGVRIINSRA